METDLPDLHIPGYKLLHLIGKGANASVYLALQESLNRHVALKLLQKFDSPAQAMRFFNEGQIVASLNHPNIITIYDIGSAGSQQYIAMEYLEGGSLRDRIKRGVSLSDTLNYIQSVASALEIVHMKDIVHRDIKPENILFHKAGSPKITDFGVAKVLDRDMNLTMDGTALGSPYYLSPEQAQGRDLDFRSDIYSLGVILFEMLAEDKPFVGESQIEVIFAHLNDPIPELPEKYRRYQPLVEKMLAKEAEGRFACSTDLLDYINSLQNQGRNVPDGKAIELELCSESAPRKSTISLLEPLRKHPLISSITGLAVVVSLSAWLVNDLASQRIKLSVNKKNAVQQQVLENKAVSQAPTPVLKDERKPDTLSESVDISRVAMNSTPDDETTEINLDPLSANIQTSFETNRKSAAETSPETADKSLQETVTENKLLPVKETPRPESESTTMETSLADNQSPSIESPQKTPETSSQETLTESNAAPGTETRLVEESISDLLRKADIALKAYRLTTPANDSAYFYYKEILKLDAHNRKAKLGIIDISSIYARLSAVALSKGDETKATSYIKRGLRISPRDTVLLAKKEHLKNLKASRLAAKPIAEVESPAPTPASPPKPVNNTLEWLESLE